MNRKTSVVAALLSVLLISACSEVEQPERQVQTPEWDRVATSNDKNISFYFKPGSVDYDVREEGDSFVTVIAKMEEKSTGRIKIRMFYLPVDSCKKESGRIFETTLEGRKISAQPFAFGSETMASHAAEAMCAILRADVEASGVKWDDF